MLSAIRRFILAFHSLPSSDASRRVPVASSHATNMANDTAPTRQLSFASPSSSDRVTYSLLTLPPALAALLAEEASDSPLEIRGNATDAAVLVTKDRTYTLRGVQNSNSLCLCSSGTAGDEGRGWFAGGDVDDYSNMKTDKDSKTIEIETVLHETLEVAPTVARTERLETLLRGTEYAGDDSPLTTVSCVPPCSRSRACAASADLLAADLIAGTQRLTLDALRSELPASDAEILSSLRTHRAIRLPQPSSPDSGSGEQVDLIRRVPPSYMLKVLPVLLSALDDARAVVRDEGGGESLAAAEAAAAAQKEKAEALRRALNGSKLKKPLTKGKEKEKEKEKSAATAGMDTLTPLELELDAEVDDLLTAWDAVDCGESAAHALLSWFVAPLPGDGGRVRVRVHDVVRELGMSTMEAGGVRSCSANSRECER